MSRLEWTRKGDSWRAGRYSIELAAPRTWVLTVAVGTWSGDASGAAGPEVIAKTSGSLKALKADAEGIERARLLERRRRRYLVVVLAAALILFVAANSEGTWAPAIITVVSGFLVWAVIRLVDATISRSWEFVSGVYQ